MSKYYIQTLLHSMSDGWIRRIFGGNKKVQPMVESVVNTNVSRKVNFGLPSDKQQQSKVISFPGLQDKAISQKVAAEKLRAQKDQFQQVPVEIQEQPVTDIDQRYDRIECKTSFKQLEFNKDDILPGEVIVLYEKKIIELKMQKNLYVPGEFILTNYKFVFRPASKDVGNDRDDYYKVPLGMIDKIEKRNQNNRKKEALPKLIITLKDLREFKFRFPMIETLKRVSDEINRFAFVHHKRHFFAFRYYQNHKDIEEKFGGWQIYDFQRQMSRIGLKLMPHSQKLVTEFPHDYKWLDNRDGKISSTYPKLLVVPSRLSYDYIVRCSMFRSRERLPALTYAVEYSPGKMSTLFRSSQPKVGVSKNRCIEDEMMLRMIGDPKTEIREEYKGKPNCMVYDARSYYAAMGNMVAGKGYELVEVYKNCEIQWLDIPNIHSVREAYVKLRGAAFDDDAKFGVALAESGWYDMIFTILSGSRKVASSLLKGVNCLVHCSDGWDRTAQLCAIAQVILDPYFRTLDGFIVLVQKEFVSFGHQFCQRMGQGMNKPNNQQKSQVFIQFLDCMTQILYQFPLSFQYNIRLLSDIANKSLTHQFGTFLCDSQLHQLRTFIPNRTVSLWSYIRQNKQLYMNPYYQQGWSKFLDVSVAQKNMRFWKEHFLYYADGFKDVYSIYSCDWSDENQGVIHSQKKKENQLLRDKHMENQKTIRRLQKQIEEEKRKRGILDEQQIVG